MVGQLHGNHLFSETFKMNWSAGYNKLNADEPNRIRNEVNFNQSIVELGRTGNTQQRKSYQLIEDNEFNALANAEIAFINQEEQKATLVVGGNFRNKMRDFRSQFYGVGKRRGVTVTPTSIDNLSAIFTQDIFDSNQLRLNIEQADRYNAELLAYAGFLTLTYQIKDIILEGGLRYDSSRIDITYDAAQAPGGRRGSRTKQYDRFFPSFNVKYAANDKHSLRLAGSLTQTLPEFKEIAPFQYVSPTGLITFGNPDIIASKNLNLDLKWEYFYSDSELVSITSFYKAIQDPINASVTRGSTGYFSYFNTANKATVYGVELESRINLITQNDQPKLRLNFNATRMWHSQDLKDVYDENGAITETFKYKNLSKTGLQGASDLIINTSLNYTSLGEKPIETTLAFNYASEKIVILGGPEDQATKEIDYNDAIVENGIPSLDFILKKTLTDKLQVSLTAKNLLNPNIYLTQLVKNPNSGIETNETVLSYTSGKQIRLNIQYNF